MTQENDTSEQQKPVENGGVAEAESQIDSPADTHTAKNQPENGRNTAEPVDPPSTQMREDHVETPAGKTADEELAALREQLAEVQRKAQENFDKAVRAQAELENVRRRSQRDVEAAHKFALEKFVSELLAVKDSLELGYSAAQGDEGDLAKISEGMELTIKMLAGVFEKFGVEEVNPLGETFNPERHEAMSLAESVEHEPNTVMMVYQKGYLLNDRLIRAAKVIVSKAAAAAPDAEQA